MQDLINFPGDPLDTPIYRIYSYDTFLKILQAQQDRLSNPRTWPDPLDNFLLRQTRVTAPGGVMVDVSTLANGWYVQCWSLQENSDAMWSVYGTYTNTSGQGGIVQINPQNFAKCCVQVRSTPRKLLSHFKKTLKNSSNNLFCGHVHYIEDHEFHAKISGHKFDDFVQPGGQKLLAEFMCLKRMAFAHEQEIRFIYLDVTKDSKHSFSEFHYFPFDPNTLFDEVVLDPRLKSWEYTEVKNTLTSKGINLNIRQSDLYKEKLFEMSFV